MLVRPLVIALSLLLLGGCTGAGASSLGPIDVAGRVEPLDGTGLKKVTLSESAADRMDLETVVVSPGPVRRDRRERSVVPYSSLLYRPDGTSVVYTNPAPLVFVAQPVVVESISGDTVVLTGGPSPGTRVVRVGAAELLGVELGVGR